MNQQPRESIPLHLLRCRTHGTHWQEDCDNCARCIEALKRRDLRLEEND